MEDISGFTDEGILLEVTSTASNWDDYTDIDTAQHNFPNYLWHRKSATEIAIKTCIVLLIGIIGIFLNSIIVITIAKNRYLWTVSNVLVGNLALMDLLSLVFCPWFMLVRDFFQNFVLRHFGCRFEGFMQASFMLTTLFAVILVSYDRLAIAVLTSDAKITKAAALKLIIGSWVVSSVLSIPWITNREFVERVWLDHIELYCAEDLKVLFFYWHFIVAMVVLLPLAVLFITYGTILIRLECGFRQLSSRGSGQSISKVRGKAMRISACILFAAVVCRLPYAAFLFWMQRLNYQVNSVEGPYEIMLFVANTLMYFNSAINPLIYGFTNMRLKKAMDKTPGIACFRFGSWCCLFPLFTRKVITSQAEDKNTEKIFIIESSPRPNNKLTRIFKNIVQSNKGSMELSLPKVVENTTKPTRVTPLKIETIDGN